MLRILEVVADWVNENRELRRQLDRSHEVGDGIMKEFRHQIDLRDARIRVLEGQLEDSARTIDNLVFPKRRRNHGNQQSSRS